MVVRRRALLGGVGTGALALAGCGTPRLPADARLPRPDHVYVADFHVSPATVNLDTNQFSYVMGAFAMPRDARSRTADAAAAQQAIATTLLAELRALGLPAAPAGTAAPPGGTALLLTGRITNITEGLPSNLAEIAVGDTPSQVNARCTLLWRAADGTTQPWRELTEAAPVTANGAAEADSSDPAGTPMGFVLPRTADARTREVAVQSRRLAIRLARQVQALAAAQGWLPPQPPS